MILKLIVFVLIAGLIYRWFGGKIPFIDTEKKPKEEHEFGSLEATSKCANCGVYMTEEDALIYHRKAYCSNECVEASKKKLK
ncbi:MAG: hypothetical protein KU29_04650 [Sulfurovum sp. FS06-10]|jgi:hypothetical protein|nr:MAG: hypothetical protein KU29_04650 [Sulfurovum sp. FS06-10]